MGEVVNENKKRDTVNTLSLSTIDLYEHPLPPDGGYGWIIVLAAFCNNVIADGLTFSFGIIFSELIMNYEQSHFKTSLITSLFNGIPLLFGPVTSLLTEKYSCKKIAVIGGYLTHLGFFLSSFTKTFNALFVPLSIIAPVGLSFIYIPSIVMVSRYFDKKRALATGIAVSGSGIGAIVFSPLIGYMCDEYTLKGALLILSGIILHVCFFGMLFKPIYSPGIDKYKALIFQKAYDSFVKKVGSIYEISENRSYLSELGPIFPKDFKVEKTDSQKYQFSMEKMKPSLTLTDKRQSNTNLSKVQGAEEIASNSKTIPVTVESTITLRFSSQHSDSSSQTFAKQSFLLQGIKPYIEQDHRAIFGNRTIGKSMRITMESELDRGATTENIHHRVVAKSRFHSKYYLKLLKNKKKENIFMQFWLFLCGIFDLNLLRKWTFCGLVISNFMLYACFPIAYNNLPYYSYENILLESTHYPLLLGIGNCVGQLSLGFLGDLYCIQSITLYTFTLLIAGVCCLILPFYKYYYNGYIIYSLVFGYTISANFSLCSVVLVDTFGLEQLTSTYGMVLFGQGIGCLIGPGISGFLRDFTESYDVGFFFSGFGIITSSIILIPLIISRNNYLISLYQFYNDKYNKPGTAI